ncbi:MAG: PAS domain-containing sensor histidine kinase, partial [Coprothermobacterota bacterium]|nr:PAS domain-containing sensor histidine kinase [Coprothermobacterota bacterium]
QDGVYRSSHEGKFLEVNPAMVKMLGYESKEELLAIDIKSQLYFAPEDRESAALVEKLEEMGVFRLRKKDGSEIWVEDHGRHVVNDEGAVLYHEGVLRDITDRKQLEERIRQVRSDLLFAVSHDLKSPLQALHQSQEMLNELTPGEGLARFQEYSEIWRRNLQRLERMINNLMDSQRGEEGRFPLLLAPCDPVELVKRVAEDLTGSALSLQATFDLTLQPVPQGACDEEALSRVVENLLTNAVKFSQGGGRVEVRLGMEENVLLLEVQDPAHEKRIPGTGLGLYVCRRIVEEHGGSISLASEEGKGTIVTVRLPWGGIIGT